MISVDIAHSHQAALALDEIAVDAVPPYYSYSSRAALAHLQSRGTAAASADDLSRKLGSLATSIGVLNERWGIKQEI